MSDDMRSPEDGWQDDAEFAPFYCLHCAAGQPVVCGECGVLDIDHIALPSPTYHYHDHRQADGATLRTPVLDGHFWRPAHSVNGRSVVCEA